MKIYKKTYKDKFDLVVPDYSVIKKYNKEKQQRIYGRKLTGRILKRLRLLKKILDEEYPNVKFFISSSLVDGSYIDKKSLKEERTFCELKKSKKTWQGRYPKRFKLSDIDVVNGIGLNRMIKVKGETVVDDSSKDYDWILHIYPDKGENKKEIDEFINEQTRKLQKNRWWHTKIRSLSRKM